jgi:hypothetical protein
MKAKNVVLMFMLADNLAKVNKNIKQDYNKPFQLLNNVE